MINAIIVDDEIGCVSNLKHFLAKYCPEINIVATANNIKDACHLFGSLSFDVAFLDIELGSDNMLNVLKDNSNRNFDIVFVTAYENYAVQAFKVEAADYLMKPLLRADIIDCYKKLLKKYDEQNNRVITEADSEKMMLKEGSNVYVVKQTDVYYLKAKGGYTEVAFDYEKKAKSLLLSKSLGDMEVTCNPKVFFRVHKSYLINYKKVNEIIKGDLTTIRLENGMIIPVAQRRIHAFIDFIQFQKV